MIRSFCISFTTDTDNIVSFQALMGTFFVGSENKHGLSQTISHSLHIRGTSLARASRTITSFSLTTAKPSLADPGLPLKITMQRRMNNNTTPQALADAALTFLSPRTEQFGQPTFSSNASPAPITVPPLVDDLGAYSSEDQDVNLTLVNCSKPQIKSEIEAPTPALPSLLRYVDNVLMRDKSRHDHPPHAGQKCMICNVQWNKASTASTFLPLVPCNDWVHYRCLIWLATREGPHKDKCYACNTSLYEWDGISALTLATRTSLPLGDSYKITLPPGTRVPARSDVSRFEEAAYEQDCRNIDNVITRRFFTQLKKPTGFSDNSPDLMQCYDSVLSDLAVMGWPQSMWLKSGTRVGSLLFGTLVAIKMRRFLVEGHGGIVQTEAWTVWMDGYRSLQGRIMEEVHGE